MGRALPLGAIFSAAFSRPAAVSLRMLVKLMLTVCVVVVVVEMEREVG
jgi:hypothetical protein